MICLPSIYIFELTISTCYSSEEVPVIEPCQNWLKGFAIHYGIKKIHSTIAQHSNTDDKRHYSKTSCTQKFLQELNNHLDALTNKKYIHFCKDGQTFVYFLNMT